MRYFKREKRSGTAKLEIHKAEAKRLLTGWWKQDALDDIFDNDKEFRLDTPYVDVWTEDENGRIPMANFYGVVG